MLKDSKSRTHPFKALALYLVVVFVGGALLAPLFYKLAQSAAEFSPVFHDLAEQPFRRYVSRSLMVLALAGLWPLLQVIGIRSGADLGIGRLPHGWRRLGVGVLLGFASLAVIVLIAVAAKARTLNTQQTVASVIQHLLNASLAAAAVSILEEILFRGAIFGSLRKAVSWPTALVASSLVYAFAHFIGRPDPTGPIQWFSGFAALAAMIQNFTEFEKVMPGFLNLTLAGCILGIAYHKSRTLYLSIGLHAGWIFWLKSYNFLFTETDSVRRWVWGTNKLIDGWIAALVLTAVLVALLRYRFESAQERNSHMEKPAKEDS